MADLHHLSFGSVLKFLPPSLEREIPMKDILKLSFVFWGLSTLYFSMIGCLMGMILSALQLFQVLSNFDFLLPLYMGSTFFLWLSLTPFILKKSLKMVPVLVKK